MAEAEEKARLRAEEERKQVLNKNEKLETFTDEMSKITNEVQKQNKELEEERFI